MRKDGRQGTAGYATLLAALVLAGPPAAVAATIHVAPSEVAIAHNGRCSLREAIHNANADAQVDNSDCPAGNGNDVIALAAGSTYTILDEIESGDGLPVITSTVTIQGNGATIERDATLSCNLDHTHDAGEFRIFGVASSGNLIISRTTIENGCADGGNPFNDGGAIYVNGGMLELSQVTVRANAAQDFSGGVDGNAASSIVIVDSTIAQNRAFSGAGGVGNGSVGTMTILRSTITGNSAPGGGGVGNDGVMDIINSTISGNTADGIRGGGGGIGNNATLRIASSTIFDNAATAGRGGGIGNAGSVEIRNSIVAGSTSGGDCVTLGTATFTALGANLDSDGSCPGFTQTTLAALALGPLAANGGPTETHALGKGSVALDVAPSCVSVDGSTPITEDQRGVLRPQNGICDIGAFERQVLTTAPVPVLGTLGGLFAILALVGVAARQLKP